MNFKCEIDLKQLKLDNDREAKRLVHNTALALNETAKVIQLAQRANLDRKFQIRRAGFMYRLIKITQFASATKGIPFAEIVIDPTKSRVLLAEFETGGVKVPAVGKSVAVPLTGEAARPSFESQVQITIQGLHFQKRKTKTGTQWVGRNGTYIVPGVGVFQRTRGGKEAKLIYAFEKDPPIKKVLGFIDLAVSVAIKEWPRQFALAYVKPR